MNFDAAFLLEWVGRMSRVSWQAGLLILMVWGLCRWGPRVPARARCWLWRLVFLKCCLGLLWATPVRVPVLPAEVVGAAADQPARWTAIDPATDIRTPAPLESLHAHPPLVPASTPAPGPMGPPLWLVVLFGAWAAGVGVCLVHGMRDWRMIRRVRAAAVPAENEALLEEVTRCSHAAGLRRAPLVSLAEGLSGPMVTGIRHPIILLPTEMVSRLEPNQVRMILAHEMAHIRRRDLTWNLLPMVARSLFFFHPLVWLAHRQWLLAQELACDQSAMGSEPSRIAGYGRALVSVAEGRLTSFTHPGLWSAGVFVSPSTLKQRILAMKNYRTDSRCSVVLWAGLILAGGALILVPWQPVARAGDGPDGGASEDLFAGEPQPELPIDAQAPVQGPFGDPPSDPFVLPGGFDFPAAESPMVTRVFALQHVSAAQVADLLAGLLKESSTVVADERTNQLLVRGSARDQEAWTRLVAALDRRETPKPQAMGAGFSSMGSDPFGAEADDMADPSTEFGGSFGEMDPGFRPTQEEEMFGELGIAVQASPGRAGARAMGAGPAHDPEQAHDHAHPQTGGFGMMGADPNAGGADSFGSRSGMMGGGLGRQPVAQQTSSFGVASDPFGSAGDPRLLASKADPHRAQVLALLDQEIALAEQGCALVQNRIEAGTIDQQELYKARKDLLGLQLDKARLVGDRARTEALHADLIGLLETQAATLRAHFEAGTVSSEAMLAAQRDILAEQRRHLQASMR